VHWHYLLMLFFHTDKSAGGLHTGADEKRMQDKRKLFRVRTKVGSGSNEGGR
jgi:hypothetical protein